MNIERRWSAPAAPPRWQDHDLLRSDAASYDYTTSSESDAEQRYEDYVSEKALAQRGCESAQDMIHCFMVCSHDLCEAYVLRHLHSDAVRAHVCFECVESEPGSTGGLSEAPSAPVDCAHLGRDAREPCGMTHWAMDNFITSGGTEPHPTYTEDDYIEGISPYSTEHEHIASAIQESHQVPCRQNSRYRLPAIHYHNGSVARTSSMGQQSLAGDDPSSLGHGSLSNSSNVSSSTRLSSLDRYETNSPLDSLLGCRRVRRKKACYFGVSNDLRDANGEPLITRRARCSRDV